MESTFEAMLVVIVVVSVRAGEQAAIVVQYRPTAPSAFSKDMPNMDII